MIIFNLIPYLAYLLPFSSIFIVIASLTSPWYELNLNGFIIELKVFNYFFGSQKLSYEGNLDNMFTVISAVLIVSIIANGIASMIKQTREKIGKSLGRLHTIENPLRSIHLGGRGKTSVATTTTSNFYSNNNTETISTTNNIVISNSISTYVVPPNLSVKIDGFYQFQLQEIPINIQIGCAIPTVSYHQYILKPILRKTLLAIRVSVFIQLITQLTMIALVISSFCYPWYSIYDKQYTFYIFKILSYFTFGNLIYNNGEKSYSGMDLQGTFATVFSFYIIGMVCALVASFILVFKLFKNFFRDPMLKVTYIPFVTSVFMTIGFFSFFSIFENLDDDDLTPISKSYLKGFWLAMSALIVCYTSSLFCILQIICYRRQLSIRSYRSEQIGKKQVNQSNFSMDVSQHRIVNTHPMINIQPSTIDPGLVYSIQYELTSANNEDSYFEFKYLLQPAHQCIPIVKFSDRLEEINDNLSEEIQPLLVN
ncbi:hypothetical protein PPL_03305 [Heterostelium album PN500]|uniref:Transmembrane protein n=1 Tax=Heterostelium pallidum (strain ATCC 26659 / Pp 5 / PN500) TaxID=670386 RepID=D3B4I0_HETP5|nr:hypothetical protein PPL_03305 [Heterostelium album PN500]EFA84228.1 hypothetical protein PPL_03305 [Heterostelium album PN500]|eukprot:XP_020436344.1 hypothetical protein PPL_03305 [Heterostelium album PN500]